MSHETCKYRNHSLHQRSHIYQTTLISLNDSNWKAAVVKSIIHVCNSFLPSSRRIPGLGLIVLGFFFPSLEVMHHRVLLTSETEWSITLLDSQSKAWHNVTTTRGEEKEGCCHYWQLISVPMVLQPWNDKYALKTQNLLFSKMDNLSNQRKSKFHQ